MLNPKIIIRADGNSEIGLGHISRCCALAEMLKNDFEIFFYTRASAPAVLEDIKNYCTKAFTISSNISFDEEASQWVSYLEGNEIVVLDGYNFNTNYQQKIKEKGCKLVCIDDLHAYHFVADVVINHAPGVAENKYSAEAYTNFCLGTDYLLLKQIFLCEAAKPAQDLDLKNSALLICFGGADPDNIAESTVKEMCKVFLNRVINVVVGAAYKHETSLYELIQNNPFIKLHKNISANEMLALMQQSHIAITSASTTALEYICVKGNLFLKCIADNQKEIYKSLIKKDCAYAFELIKDQSHSGINISNQHTLIDGKSGMRLLKIFKSLSQNNIEFKIAGQTDVDLLFEWINDRDVRKQSLISHEISYEEHSNWFTKKLADKNCYLYFVYKNNVPVGMIRFDRNDKECTVSYLVDYSQRGKNIGTQIINNGIDYFIKTNNFKGIMKAVVKSGNIASIKIFKKEGFEIVVDGDLYIFKKLI